MPRKHNFLIEPITAIAPSFGNRYTLEADISPSPTEALPPYHTIVLGLPGHEHCQDAAERQQAAYEQARVIEDVRKRIDEGFGACSDARRNARRNTAASSILKEDENPVLTAAANTPIFGTFEAARERRHLLELGWVSRCVSTIISTTTTTTTSFSSSVTTQPPPSEDNGSSPSVLESLSKWWTTHNTKDPIDLTFLEMSKPEHTISPKDLHDQQTSHSDRKNRQSVTTSSSKTPALAQLHSPSNVPQWLHNLFWTNERTETTAATTNANNDLADEVKESDTPHVPAIDNDEVAPEKKRREVCFLTWFLMSSDKRDEVEIRQWTRRDIDLYLLNGALNK